MAYSTKLTLYQGAPIDPARNMKIESIEDLLSNIVSVSWTDFKRLFPAETQTVKVAYSDEETVFSQISDMMFNYARVDYGDGDNLFSWYYFVTSMRFIADSTFEVEMSLDVLNSFAWESWLSPRTYVRRALTKRWESNGMPVLPFTAEDAQGEIVRSDDELIPTSPVYLVWRNYESGKPACYYIPQSSSQVKDAFASLIVESGLRFECTGLTSFLIDSGKGTASKTLTAGAYIFVSGIISDSKGNQINKGYIINDSGTILLEATGATGSLIENTMKIKSEGKFRLFRETWVISQQPNGGNVSFTKTGEEKPLLTSPFSTLDRTQSDLAKIVEIPYPAEGANLIYEIDSDKHVYGRFVNLENSISWSTTQGLDGLDTALKPTNPADTRTSAYHFEPKLYSKQFVYYKFVYDSYAAVVGIDDFANPNFNVNITMTPSSSVSSSLIFRLEPVTGGWNEIKEDFPFLIASDRNNEVAIYSSAWIDYLRNGYNYDKKKQGVDIATTSLSTVGSLLTSVMSIIGGAGLLASGGGAPAGVSMIAGGVASAVGSSVGAGTSIASINLAQEQREANYRRQAMNVASINDLSLFKAYGGGGLRVQRWQPRDDFNKRLQAMFYYRGYNVSQVQAPQLHVRKWFDFIECAPSWTSSALENCQQRFLTLLEQKLGEGVTIFHKVEKSWDLTQEKGNYEIDN